MAPRIMISTTDWTDNEFQEIWYPPDTQQRERLTIYAERFNGVEVNSTFHKLPRSREVIQWAMHTPEHFSFDVQLHQLFTYHHTRISQLPRDMWPSVETKKGGVLATQSLKEALLERTLELLDPLCIAERLSSLVLQLAPAFNPKHASLSELDWLIERVAPRRLAFEFRHRGWIEPDQANETFSYLKDRDVAFVCVDTPDQVHENIVPGDLTIHTREDLAYLRIHGRDAQQFLRGISPGDRLDYKYQTHELQEIAERIQLMANEMDGGDVRVIFNDNHGAEHPDAAHYVQELLEVKPGRPQKPKPAFTPAPQPADCQPVALEQPEPVGLEYLEVQQTPRELPESTRTMFDSLDAEQILAASNFGSIKMQSQPTHPVKAEPSSPDQSGISW